MTQRLAFNLFLAGILIMSLCYLAEIFGSNDNDRPQPTTDANGVTLIDPIQPTHTPRPPVNVNIEEVKQ